MPRIGHGTTLKFVDSANVIGEVFNIDPFEISVDEIDVTTYASEDKYREYMAGLLEPGEISFECHIDESDAGQNEAIAALGGAAESFELEFPSAVAKWEFDAYVSGYAPSSPLDDKMTATITLKLTGKSTFTIAGS